VHWNGRAETCTTVHAAQIASGPANNLVGPLNFFWTQMNADPR